MANTNVCSSQLQFKMEINVAEGMSRALNVGVIITLRQGLNQHQTLASGGGRTTQKEPRLFNSLSL